MSKRRHSVDTPSRRGKVPTAKAAPVSFDEEKLQAHFARGGTLAEFMKQNPGADRREVTDRAKRYRAQKSVKGPKVCAICGKRGGRLDVMHLTGNESHGERENLAYGCRSCNTKLAHAFKSIGAGRPTRQYNPASGNVPTFEQYLWAVSNHTRTAHDAGGAIIHATPRHKRIEYAQRIAGFVAKQRRARDDERWNPADGAAAAFEEFQGRKSGELVEVTERTHHHKHLAAAGELKQLVVMAIDGKAEVKLSGFAGSLLAFNERKNQLFITGGDQAVDLREFGIDPRKAHELETLGKVKSLDYFTRKDHLGDEGGEAIFRHKLRTTNENGRHVTVRVARYPDLIYRVRDKKLEFSGGSYEIRAEGIDL